ncbi:MAG: hypothetical protein CL923_06150 [Deltaproteobacteria bacterium]|nr:hypothetical protein [Deltaproteobacteria bacterium]MDP7156929.1 tetratricopeptide repeat protein [SAR324 cluster bacterium]
MNRAFPLVLALLLSGGMDFPQAVESQGAAWKAQVHFQRAKAYVRTHQPEPALKAFNRALQLNPDHPEIHHRRGTLLYQLGRLPEACQSWRHACDLKRSFCQGLHFGRKGDLCFD